MRPGVAKASLESCRRDVPQPLLVGRVNDRGIVDARVHARPIDGQLVSLAIDNRPAIRVEIAHLFQRIGSLMPPIFPLDQLQLRGAKQQQPDDAAKDQQEDFETAFEHCSSVVGC